MRHARRKLVEAWHARVLATPLPPMRLIERDAEACRALQANAPPASEQLLQDQGGASGGMTVVHGDAFDALAGLSAQRRGAGRRGSWL